MKKVAILCSIRMFNNTSASGIRLISVNIYFALRQLGYDVEFVVSNPYKANHFTYNKLILNEEEIKQNFFHRDLKINIKSLLFPFILPRRKKLKFQYKTKAVDINSYSHIFTSFLEWDKLTNYNLRQDIKIFNIYHDNIQETYRFLKQWSTAKTSTSYAVWKKNMLYSNKILCISEDAKSQFKTCFEKYKYFKEENLAVLPSIILPLFYEQTPKFEEREDAIVIGSIFDERKKPLETVEVINRMQNIKKLYIYGSRRCPKSLFRKVFHNLRKDIEVEYFMQASNKTLIEIFSKSKAMLFPSEFEGLGLPIIEAQVRGCPVMVRNKAPMNSLLMEGSVVMSEDLTEDAKTLDNILKNFKENETLKQQAQSFYSSEKLANFLKSIL